MLAVSDPGVLGNEKFVVVELLLLLLLSGMSALFFLADTASMMFSIRVSFSLCVRLWLWTEMDDLEDLSDS